MTSITTNVSGYGVQEVHQYRVESVLRKLEAMCDKFLQGQSSLDPVLGYIAEMLTDENKTVRAAGVRTLGTLAERAQEGQEAQILSCAEKALANADEYVRFMGARAQEILRERF